MCLSTLVPAWLPPHAALFSSQALISTFHIVGRFILPYFPPFVFSALRAIMAVPVLFILAHFLDGADSLPLRSRLLHAVNGGVFLAGAILGMIVGLALAGAVQTAVFQVLVPIWTVLLALALRQERVSILRLLGITLAIFGALVLIGLATVASVIAGSDADTGAGDAYLWGSLALVVNTSSFSVFMLFQKRLLTRYGRGTTATAWNWLGAMVTLTAAAAATSETEPWAPGAIPVSAWIGIVYCSSVTSVLVFALFAYGLGRVSPSTGGFYVTVQPLCTALMSAAFLPDESLGWNVLLGGMLIIAGLVCVTMAQKHELERGGTDWQPLEARGFVQDDEAGIPSVVPKVSAV